MFSIWNCHQFDCLSLFEYLCYLWVYGDYKYFNPFSAGIVFIRQNLTSTDVRISRIKTVPELEVLICDTPLLLNWLFISI